MIQAPMAAHGRQVQFAEVHATVCDAQGKVMFDGILDRTETEEHKAQREASALARAVRKVAPLIAMALLGLGAHYLLKADASHAVPAASVITNVGQSIVTNRMTSAGTEPKFVMWGTGAGTAAITDTTLFTETTDEARTTGTSSRVTTTVTNDTYQVVGLLTVATAGKTITNVGLFDVVTASSGNLYFKSDFTGIALLVGESINFTIKIKFA